MLILAAAAVYAAVILFLRRGLYGLQGPTPEDVRKTAAAGRCEFSVIVAARNEAENLPECLASVFSQDIPADRYEVVVADDRSTDATAQILKEAEARYPNLRVVTVTQTPRGVSPKKHAVMTAMAASRNGIIAFTDADCRVPPAWLSSLSAYFADGAALVQGITAYSAPPPGMSRFFWGLQSADFLSHGVIAAAAVAAGLPINANANNMAFRREAFGRAGGYGDAAGVVLGDDDHLLQRVWASGGRVAFMTDPRGAVETAPTPTLPELFEQRRRWGSVTVHYGPRQVALLSAVFAFYLTIAATAVLSAIYPGAYFPVFLSLLSVKLTGELALMIPGTRIFNKKSLRKYIVPGSIMQLPMVLAAVVSGDFGKFEWKGRKMGGRV
jgi:cellulose synthase/poly-beta-1,6-N-acetylglucosamine synthase-like glycosyltransferase